jgi:hypothetical protein
MESLMPILSSLIESSWQSLFNFKKILVGDLTIQDIIRFGRERKPPERLTQTLEYAQRKKLTSLPDGSYSLIANYGLLGQILGINTAVVIGNTEKPEALKELVNTTDNLPNGRTPYRVGNHITGGVPILASRSGQEGLKAHKYLAQVLPSMEFVLETAVRFTHEALERHMVENDRECQEEIERAHEEAKYVVEELMLDEKAQQFYLERQIEKVKQKHQFMRYKVNVAHLVLKIMTYVLVGVELKEVEEHYELIRRMERREQGVAHDYRVFVKEAIHHQEINPLTQCALWKALKRNAQIDDALIHDLFTVLVTDANVSLVVALGKDNKKLLNAFIEEMRTTPQDADKRKTLRYDALKQMFESSLHRNNFQPASLPRYIEKPLEWEGQTIPGGTNLFIHHRSLETEKKHSAFSIGYRSCPGQRLAEYIFRGIITTLVERQYLNPQDTPEVDIALCYLIK